MHTNAWPKERNWSSAQLGGSRVVRPADAETEIDK